MIQVLTATALLVALAACGPTRIYTLTNPPPESTATKIQPTSSATFTPYPTYAPPTDTPVIEPSFTPYTEENSGSPVIQSAEAAEEHLGNRDIPWLMSDLVQDKREPTSAGSPLLLSATLIEENLIWDNWWCATSSGMLAGNLAVMEFVYTINEQPVDASLGVTFSQHLPDGSVCSVTGFYLTDWPQGEHELVYSYTLTGNTNDGYRVYGPGTYSKIFSIMIP